MPSIISRRTAVKHAVAGLSFGAAQFLSGQSAPDARERVAHVRQDVQRMAALVPDAEDRDRLTRIDQHLAEFLRGLDSGKFHKGELDKAIDQLKRIMKSGALRSRESNDLNADLNLLRTLHDEHWGHDTHGVR